MQDGSYMPVVPLLHPVSTGLWPESDWGSVSI